MTRPSLRNLVPTSLIVFGTLACTAAGAQSSVAASAATLPASTAYSPSSAYTIASAASAAALPSPALWSSSNPAATADSAANADRGIPDEPPPQTSGDGGGRQTKRILGIIPNFRAVSANTKLPPMSVKDKFATASEDSLDYSAIFLPAAVAGYSMARNATPEFGHGGVGYGRYLWHSAVDQTSENYFVEFIGPALTHQDPRYYTQGSGGFLKRTGYALSRVVVTRSDAGKEVFNSSEIFGAGAAASVSNLYYPSAERTVSNTVDQWGLNVGIDAATFVFKEFWPDINHYLFHDTQ
ncbi:MAG TPA: hypothetical protein VNW54_00360 [Granulicella sp.]|nr:hypothetical protein [Granulicella sp.]